MAVACTEQQEWLEEEVSKPVDQWVERTQRKCKERPWYDPRRWLCWLVTTLVKVVVWVVVKVGRWVVRTVCKVVGAIVGLVTGIFTGLWDFLAGIFTLDWRRLLYGLLEIVIALVDSILTLARVVFLIDTLNYIITDIQRGRLRTYVRTKLGFKYSGQEFQDIVDNLRVDFGAFGYRIPMRSIRTFLDSETPSPDQPGVPNLVVLNESGAINLRALCGFELDEGFWNRKRYKTLKKGPIATGGGGGEVENPISEDELDTYLNSRGAQGPKFVVLCMRDSALDARLRAAEVSGRQLGLMPQWKREDKAITAAGSIKQKGTEMGTRVAAEALVTFLADVIGRKKKIQHPPPPGGDGLLDETEALNDLCTPVAVGVFRYTSGLRGLTACLRGSSCQLLHDASGLTYIDNQPDIVWKYVAMHELGHFFGLCHVAGLQRIMFTPKGPNGQSLSTWEVIKKSLTWGTIPKLVVLDGEPTFTLDEGMQTWDYIIDNYPAVCLGAKPPVIF